MARVLHLISQLEEGGAQRQLSYFLAIKNHEMEIASLIASPPEKVFPFFRNSPVPIHFLSYSNDFYAPEILPNLRTLLKKNNYSLLHCWLFESIIQGVIAARLENIPAIAGIHGLRESLTLGNNKKWEIRMI
ncbi:MAG: hypothetical protein C5B54_09945, partial [Acidobacteria bacterium]